MKSRSFLYLFTVGLLLFVLAVPVHAFPAVTYEGEADATAIDIGLALDVLTIPSSAGVIVAGSNATLDGVADTPVTTHGDAVSAAISAGSGAFLGLDDSVNVVSTTKTYQDGDPNPETDAAGLAVSIGLPGTLSVAASAAATTTISELLPDQAFPTTIDSESSSEIEDTLIALALPLLTTGVLTSTSRTETNAIAPDHDVVSISAVTLTAVTVDLVALHPLLAGVDIAASVITADTTAINDGTTGTEAATVDYGFVGLVIDGTSYTLPPPGLVVDISPSGLCPDTICATVTIAPVQATTVTPTLSEATSVALRIVVVTGALSTIDVDTTIDLGTSHSLAAAASGPNTGPSVIDLVSLTAASPGMTPLATFAVVGLTLASIVLLRRSRL